MKDRKAAVNTSDTFDALSNWSSTYGQLTVERLLERFNITIDTTNLLEGIKNQHSFYYQLLHVPFKNLLNGLIVEQAYEYQVYLQKLFIDFLLSGKNDEPEGSPGGNAREELTIERLNLMASIENFNSEQLAQKKLIAKSQSHLITIAKEYSSHMKEILKNNFFHAEGINRKNAAKIVETLLSYELENQDISKEAWEKIKKVLNKTPDEKQKQQLLEIITPLLPLAAQLKEVNIPFIEQSEYLGNVFRDYRNEFYQLILRVNDLIQLLPGYRPNPGREEKNREAIDFDPIG